MSKNYLNTAGFCRYSIRLLVEQVLEEVKITGLDMGKRTRDEFAVPCWSCVLPIRVMAILPASGCWMKEHVLVSNNPL